MIDAYGCVNGSMPVEKFAYQGYCANPLQTCECGHRKGDHYRGKHSCLHSTPKETWACDCGEFHKKTIDTCH